MTNNKVMSSEVLIDIHTHQQCNESNVISIYNASLNDTHDTYTKESYISLGLHPWKTNQWNTESYQLLAQKITCSNVIAIGECGLDKLIAPLQWQAQLDHFEFQVQLSKKYNKPLIIHCVKAYNECLEILGNHQAIFHGFSKKLPLAMEVIKKNHFLSFGKSLFQIHSQEAFSQLPLESIFLETDNSNISIESIYYQALKIRKCSKEAFILQLQSNFQKIFNTHE